MRDAIVYGYELAEDFMNSNMGFFNFFEIMGMVDYEMVKKLIDYCGSNEKNILEAIEDWINRAKADYNK